MKAIEAHRARAGRHLLGLVEPLAERLASELRALPVVTAADFAGSLRRRRSTVRDIDLVAASDDPEAVADAFAASPEVAAVDERGPTKVVGRTHTGLGIDLRIVPPPSYGNLLQHFTGSADHNVALRGYAQQLGYKVSEYHVEHLESGRHHACATEAEVYGLLGLAFIPPELRENQGEIEAARTGALPRLIERGDLRGDLHVHSDWSDGRATMEEMAVAARERGLEYVCFCDHSQSLGMGVGLTPDRVLDEIEAVRALDARLRRHPRARRLRGRHPGRRAHRPARRGARAAGLRHGQHPLRLRAVAGADHEAADGRPREPAHRRDRPPDRPPAGPAGPLRGRHPAAGRTRRPDGNHPRDQRRVRPPGPPGAGRPTGPRRRAPASPSAATPTLRRATIFCASASARRGARGWRPAMWSTH